MKREITLGQLLSVAVTILIAFVTGWITMNNKVARLDEADSQRKENDYELKLSIEKKFNKIDDKIDNLSTTSTNILIEMQKKADRK